MSRTAILRRVLGCLLLVCLTANQPIRASENHRYIDPIVYVGEDGNLYMTDIARTTTTRLTNVTDSRFGVIRWSPDGSQFLAVERPSETFNQCGKRTNPVWLFRSGYEPEQLPLKIIHPILLTWSPNGEQFAYGDKESGCQRFGIKIFTLATSNIEDLGKFGIGCNADGFGAPEGILLNREERGGQNLSTPDVALDWIPYGILSSVAACSDIALHNLEGTIGWSIFEPGELPIISTDGKRALLGDSLVNLETGEQIKIQARIPSNFVYFISWVNDHTAIAQTVEDLLTIETEQDNPVSNAIFGGWIYARDQNIKLVEVSFNNALPRTIYERRGYAIGLMQVTPDSSAVIFSFITTSYEQAKAINEGKSEAEVRQIPGAYIELVAVSLNTKTPEVLWTKRGGQPAIGKGEFTAVER